MKTFEMENQAKGTTSTGPRITGPWQLVCACWPLLPLGRQLVGGLHSTGVAFLLLPQLPWVRFSVLPKIYFLHCWYFLSALIGESGQMLEIVNQTHLVLASAKLVPQIDENSSPWQLLSGRVTSVTRPALVVLSCQALKVDFPSRQPNPRGAALSSPLTGSNFLSGWP